MFLLHLLNVTFITTNLQYSLTNGKQTKLHGLFLNQMFNIPVSTFTFSDKIVILPREVHYCGRFTFVHFFHKSSVKVHNPPMIISFSFPASCGLFRNVSCPLVFFIRNLTGLDAQEFPLEFLLQNKSDSVHHPPRFALQITFFVLFRPA